MVKLVVLYGEPKSPAEFEKYYADVHLPIAAQMKAVRRIELSKATRTPEGGAPPFYHMAELYFDDAAHMQGVMGSPEGKKAVADLANFATGDVTVMVAEVQ